MEENSQSKPIAEDNRLWNGSFLWACTTFMVILLLFTGLRVLTNISAIRNLEPWVLDIVFSFMSQIVIMFAVPLISIWLFMRHRKKQNPAVFSNFKVKNLFNSFGFDKPTWRVIGFAFLLGFMIYFFNIFVASAFNGILNVFGYRFPGMFASPFAGVGGLFVSFALIAVLPGLCEEVTHRGMLLKSFSAKLGVYRALWFSSILFGFMHLNIVQVFYAAILGYIIGLAVVATRSLWVGIIMHFMNNFLSVYFSIARNYGWPGGDLLYNMLNIGGGFGVIIFFAGVVACYFGIMAIIGMFAKENFNRNKRLHIAQVVHNNPKVLLGENGTILTIEELEQRIDAGLSKLKPRQALRFYIDPAHSIARMRRAKPKFTPIESTMFYGTMFLGGLVTMFTLVWGLL